MIDVGDFPDGCRPLMPIDMKIISDSQHSSALALIVRINKHLAEGYRSVDISRSDADDIDMAVEVFEDAGWEVCIIEDSCGDELTQLWLMLEER